MTTNYEHDGEDELRAARRTAHALGQTEGAEEAEVAAELAASPQARQEVESVEALAARLKEAAREAPQPEPSPALRETVERRLGELEPAAGRAAVQGPARPWWRSRLVALALTAACLVALAVPILRSMNLFGLGEERIVVWLSPSKDAAVPEATKSPTAIPSLASPTRRIAADYDQRALPSKIGISQNIDEPPAEVDVDPTLHKSPTKVGEYQNLDSSSFRNADGIFSNGDRTLDFSKGDSTASDRKGGGAAGGGMPADASNHVGGTLGPGRGVGPSSYAGRSSVVGPGHSPGPTGGTPVVGSGGAGFSGPGTPGIEAPRGVITGAGGMGGITRSGGVILAGSNSYSGGTTVNSGALLTVNGGTLSDPVTLNNHAPKIEYYQGGGGAGLEVSGGQTDDTVNWTDSRNEARKDAEIPAGSKPRSATAGRRRNSIHMGSENEKANESELSKGEPKKPLETWKPAHVVPNTSRLMVGDREELPLKGMQVDVRVDGFRARVLIDLYYFNDRPQQLEGNFQLRLPDEASPYFFAFGRTVYQAPQVTASDSMFFKPQQVSQGDTTPEKILALRGNSWEQPKVARMVPKEKAALAYRDTVRRRVDPALVEWSGAGVFQCRVFPLAPQSLHRVTIGYDVDLLRVGEDLELRLDLPGPDPGDDRRSEHRGQRRPASQPRRPGHGLRRRPAAFLSADRSQGAAACRAAAEAGHADAHGRR